MNFTAIASRLHAFSVLAFGQNQDAKLSYVWWRPTRALASAPTVRIVAVPLPVTQGQQGAKGGFQRPKSDLLLNIAKADFPYPPQVDEIFLHGYDTLSSPTVKKYKVDKIVEAGISTHLTIEATLTS